MPDPICVYKPLFEQVKLIESIIKSQVPKEILYTRMVKSFKCDFCDGFRNYCISYLPKNKTEVNDELIKTNSAQTH